MIETILEHNVAWIHEDFDYINDVSVCFDTSHNLLVIHKKRYDIYNSDSTGEFDSTIVATVSAEDAYVMAKLMNVSLTDLTFKIVRKLGIGECWNNSEIAEAFSQVLCLITNLGAHYRIKHYNARDSHELWDED